MYYIYKLESGLELLCRSEDIIGRDKLPKKFFLASDIFYVLLRDWLRLHLYTCSVITDPRVLTPIASPVSFCLENDRNGRRALKVIVRRDECKRIFFLLLLLKISEKEQLLVLNKGSKPCLYCHFLTRLHAAILYLPGVGILGCALMFWHPANAFASGLFSDGTRALELLKGWGLNRIW